MVIFLTMQRLSSNDLDNRITSMMIFEEYLWVGTGNSLLHVFKLSSTATTPGECIQQLAKQNERSSDHREQKARSMSVRSNMDEGLVSEKNLLMTISPGEYKERKINQAEDSFPREDTPNRFKKRAFGKTFYRQIHREKTLDVKRDGVYKVEHLWTGCVKHTEKECMKVTAIKPIVR